MDYLDFGSSSDSDHDEGAGDASMCALDSDEEEQYENRRLLKMFNLEDAPSKSQRKIQDFEAEMEAELDRRAFEIETQGGMEHQKSLSRSSSTTSLHKSPRASPVPGTSRNVKTKSCLKRSKSNSSVSDDNNPRVKSVKFEGDESNERVGQGVPKKGDADEKKAKEMYDELYFDSDESDGDGDEEKKERKEKKRRFMTNDELFYDPSSDAKDQAWIDNQRRKSYGEGSSGSKATTPSPSPQSNRGTSGSDSGNNMSVSPANATNPKTESTGSNLPSTDAVLNCPACFTTVCHDCQRHELYVGQYRAMFVMNCFINREETLSVPEKPPKKFRKRSRKIPEGFTSNSASDIFHPVLCRICKTQVAMYDSDEVYHFFNVLASQP